MQISNYSIIALKLTVCNSIIRYPFFLLLQVLLLNLTNIGYVFYLLIDVKSIWKMIMIKMNNKSNFN